jgi:hypothetical protein
MSPDVVKFARLSARMAAETAVPEADLRAASRSRRYVPNAAARLHFLSALPKADQSFAKTASKFREQRELPTTDIWLTSAFSD